MPGVPKLAGESQIYLTKELNSYRPGERDHPQVVDHSRRAQRQADRRPGGLVRGAQDYRALSRSIGRDRCRPHSLAAVLESYETEKPQVLQSRRGAPPEWPAARRQHDGFAAISHDLQTPITRMRLRADIADDGPEKEKLVSDLREIERLVQDGIAYARSSHGNGEKNARIDLASFIDSIAYDYQDTGKAVSVTGTVQGTALTKPHALRRILTNFIDNALKFAGAAEISVERSSAGKIVITVADRGPGIPDDKLKSAMQPFYRLETSRNRDTGGTGLGLAIAQQLAMSLGGTVRIYNRSGGGLAAELCLS